jgi:hypothetical protein
MSNEKHKFQISKFLPAADRKMEKRFSGEFEL